MFAHAGFAATSMEDVAAASGVTKLIVYRHFESKEELYRVVLERVFDRQVELFVENVAAGLQAGGATRALLAGRARVTRRVPAALAPRGPRAAVRRVRAQLPRRRGRRGRARSSSRTSRPPYVEWAAQTLFDHLVDAVLNWLDHGDAEHDDESFIALEAASLRATVAAWTQTFPRDAEREPVSCRRRGRRQAARRTRRARLDLGELLGGQHRPQRCDRDLELVEVGLTGRQLLQPQAGPHQHPHPALAACSSPRGGSPRTRARRSPGSARCGTR